MYTELELLKLAEDWLKSELRFLEQKVTDFKALSDNSQNITTKQTILKRLDQAQQDVAVIKFILKTLGE